MFQPVGGMDRITDAFYQRLTEQVQLGAQVRQIRQLEDSVGSPITTDTVAVNR
ncbi:hypothetical protein ALO43_200478 [Pseudomonas tremae]|uniref:Uncharacterized protein n=1 Tax=Pseudomonas tremae TaxID=200454 RepID=A0AA40P3M8_9PSED|nr:hypothetical protein ALO43_200478 [Pseudomonas tremae]